MSTTDNALLSDCSFVGNPDLYGTGIRTGLYLQWITTLLVTLFIPRDEAFLRTVNLLMQSALLLGVIVSPPTHAIEPIITLWLLFGALSSLTGDGIAHFRHFSGVFRVLFYVAVGAYATWFWWRGMEGMVAGDCRVTAFFGGVGVEGPFRMASRVLSILGLVVAVFCIGLVVRAYMSPEEEEKEKRPQVETTLLAMSVTVIVVSIAAIEYLVKANGITGINDVQAVGQLIPLLVGSFGIVSACMKIVEERLLFRSRCWFFFGKHL